MNGAERRRQHGFTLIELMISVAIVGILSAAAVPGYIGFQEKSRRGTMDKAAAAAEAELQAWLSSSMSTGRAAQRIEVDTNYDGLVPSGDMSNSALRATGVGFQYVTARNGLVSNEKSPWDPNLPLWAFGAAGPGQIGISQVGNIIFISAKDIDGNDIFSKRVISD